MGIHGTHNVANVLPFAGDFDSAHVAEDYPYGSLRTHMRFWCEYKAGKGFRPVTCSLNPKTGKWNKPHAGTYTQALACYIEAGSGHIKFAHFSHYDRSEAGEYFAQFEAGLSEEGKRVVKFWQFTHEYTEAKGKSTLEYTAQDMAELRAEVSRRVKEFFAPSPELSGEEV